MMDIEISSDKTRLNLDVIHSYISERSYWAQGRSYAQVKKSIENSNCFGLYLEGSMIAFTRVVSDTVAVAYLLDLFVLEEHRGKGYSKRLLHAVFADPKFRGVPFMLRTSDAQKLYLKFGFEPIGSENDCMYRSASWGDELSQIK